MIKRLFDIIFSIIGLIILSPLLIIISVLIKLGDRGPVFYKGTRVGLNGKLFKMYKFRTMVINADKIGGPSSSDDDARITKIGKLLRKFKLDEFPQFINVLKGEMSFVGPRPEVKEVVGLYTERELPILTLKPGITDYASLWNSNEGKILEGEPDPHKAYMEKVWPTKAKLQLKYLKEKSFLTDIKIILQTIKTIIKYN